MIADRNQNFASDSGELRVSRRFVQGERYHVLYYSLRARDQQRRYGGSDVQDLGVARIGERVPCREPEFEFGPQTRDEVKQSTHRSLSRPLVGARRDHARIAEDPL